MKYTKLTLALLSTLAITGGYNLNAANNTVKNIKVVSEESKEMLKTPESSSETKTELKAETGVSADAEMTKIPVDKYGFTVDVPSTWKQQQGMVQEGIEFVVIALSPAEDAKDAFFENVNILVEKLDKEYTLDEYYNANLQGLTQNIVNFNLVEQKNVDINAVPAMRIEYTWGDSSKVTTYQFIFVKGDKGFVVTFTATPDTFAKYQPVFDKIANSLKFQ